MAKVAGNECSMDAVCALLSRGDAIMAGSVTSLADPSLENTVWPTWPAWPIRTGLSDMLAICLSSCVVTSSGVTASENPAADRNFENSV